MGLSSGARLGPYEILSLLGAGGMGEVYRARDTKLDRDVALKVLPDSLAQNPDRMARFQREAKVLASLNHPNIAAIYGLEESGGVSALVMELVEGKTLAETIGASVSRLMPLSEVLNIAIQIGEALEAAHEKGIIHRDLKPANIKVTTNGKVKILDFGLAKEIREANSNGATQTSAGDTQMGAVVGTPAYMSPEQTRGELLDARSDLFSFGAVLYEMTTGRQAFTGPSAASIFTAILRDDPPTASQVNPQISPGLESVITKALGKDRALRYQTAAEMRADLTAISSGSVPKATQAGQAGRRWPVALAGAAAVIIAGAIGARYLMRTESIPLPVGGSGSLPGAATETPIRSIAVLPLDNYSSDPKQDYFAEGMTDELTADLATISELRVISRGSAMQFKGANRPPTPEIAKALNVDAVVEGSVLRSGDKVRITAELIDARADKHLWAKSFERNSRDVLALQDELASAIAREIHVQLSPSEKSRLSSAQSVSPEAHDAYLKGRYFFNRPSDENLKKAIEQFNEAVRLSPNFAPAWSGLSDAYAWAGFNEGFMSASDARPMAKEAAEKALQLDDSSAEAHTSLATYKLFYDYDWAGAEAEYQRAIQLNPNYAYAHDQLGVGLAFQGMYKESQEEALKAASLDPLSPQIPLDAAIDYLMQNDFQAGNNAVKRSIELDPSYFLAPMIKGWINLESGKAKEAIPDLQKSATPESPGFANAYLGYAYGASGDRAGALAQIEVLKKKAVKGNVPPYNLALIYLGLGDRNRAMDYLEKAYAADSEWLGWLGEDRIFDPLRSEPRFHALLKKLNLER